jgi:hypothetical protein
MDKAYSPSVVWEEVSQDKDDNMDWSDNLDGVGGTV